MTDDDTLTCCPDCRAADIRVHSASTINHDGRPPRYKCHECGLRFDEPAERRRESTTAANSGTAAAALEAANPDRSPGTVSNLLRRAWDKLDIEKEDWR